MVKMANFVLCIINTHTTITGLLEDEMIGANNIQF